MCIIPRSRIDNLQEINLSDTALIQAIRKFSIKLKRKTSVAVAAVLLNLRHRRIPCKVKKKKHHLLLQFSLICFPCEKKRPPQKPSKQTTIATKTNTAQLSGSPCLDLTVSTFCVFVNLKRRLLGEANKIELKINGSH